MNRTLQPQASFPRTRYALACWMSSALLAGAIPENPGDTPGPDRDALMNNAALYYWKAMASMQKPRTPLEVSSTAFIRQELPELPPRAFSVRKDAAIWLIGENALITSLQQAQQVEVCAFPIRQAGSPSLNLTHLPPMRELTRYALEISKAYEYADNASGAAKIYILLLDMIRKLQQDSSLTSIQAGWAMLQDVLFALEGFTTRSPPADVLDILLRYFDEHPDLSFQIGDCLISESSRYSQWLQETPEQIIPRLSSLYDRTNDKPAVLRLSSLSTDEQVSALTNWTRGYRDRMGGLTSWMDKPYVTGLPQLEMLDDSLEKDINMDGAKVDNPLIPLLVPYTRSLYEQSLLAEGQYRMMQLVLEAARYQSLLKKWPKNPEALEAFTSQPLPRDPFTGKKIFFRIRNKAPYLALSVPKWMAGESALMYRLQLAIRKNLDDKNFQRFQKSAIQKFIKARQDEPLIKPGEKK